MRALTLGLVAVVATAVAGRQTSRPAQLSQRERARAAIERTVPLLQRSAQTWIEKQTCSSCHHQALGTLNARFAALVQPKRHD
jgi:hypothetical protein